MKRLSVFLLLIFAVFNYSNLFADGDMDFEDEADTADECDTHDDCEATYACLEGYCTELEENLCNKDSDCVDSDMYCEIKTNSCRQWCNGDSHCIPDIEYCDMDTYKCEPIPTVDGDSDTEGEDDNFCMDDWDCETGHVCNLQTHNCEPACYSPDDCQPYEKCQDMHCVPLEDGDEDTPWVEDGDLDEDQFEIPEDYEMPPSNSERDTTEGGTGTIGGLTDCKPGEVCTDDGDNDGSADSSGCSQTNPQTLLLLTLLLMLLFVGRSRVED